MKIEISDTLIVILIVVLSILVLGLIIVIIYLKVERNLRNKVKKQIEEKQAKGQELVKKLERAGIIEKAFVGKQAVLMNKAKRHGLGGGVQIEIGKGELPSSAVNKGEMLVTTTTRLRLTTDTELGIPEQRNLKLVLDDSTMNAKGESKSDIKLPVVGSPADGNLALETQFNDENPHNNSKIDPAQTTFDRIKNFRLEDHSINSENLERSEIKTPKLSSNTVSIQYKSGNSTNPFPFSGTSKSSKTDQKQNQNP